jgi:hypothetical protein
MMHWKWLRKKREKFTSMYCPGIPLEEPRKTTINFSDGQYLARNSKRIKMSAYVSCAAEKAEKDHLKG